MIREIIAYKDYYCDFMSKLNDKEQMKFAEPCCYFLIRKGFLLILLSTLKMIYTNFVLRMVIMSFVFSSFMMERNW